VLIFIIGGFFGVLTGTISADRVSVRQLNRAFGLFAIFVALYLLYVNVVS
jgi:uncharacterized membrane protein YfcA